MRGNKIGRAAGVRVRVRVGVGAGLTILFLLIACVSVALGQEVVLWPQPSEQDNPKIQRVLEGLIASYRAGLPLTGSSPQTQQAGMAISALRIEGDRVQVVIEAASEAANSKIIERISQLGGQVELTYEALIQAFVPIKALEDLASLEEVIFIRLPVLGQRSQVEGPMLSTAQGSVVSEGVAVIGAPQWQRAGFTGEGVKVGIIDIEFGTYQRLLGRELPPSDRVVARSFMPHGRMYNPELPEDEQVHGTAVAEVIYDIAPGATFYLGASETDVQFRQAVEWLIGQKPDVISTSVGWYSGCFQGDGIFEPLFRRARQNGITWSTSAGNEADSHWEGTFTDQNNNRRHEFARQDEDITVEVKLVEGEIRGERMPVAMLGFVLSWDATCTGASDDYDVVIFPSDDPSRRGAGDWLWSPGVPIKISGWVFGFPNLSVGDRKRFSVVIEKKRTGASPARFDLVMTFCMNCVSLEHVEPRGSVSIHEPAISPNTMAVGAVHHNPSRCPSWACPERPLLWYSSQGPTKDGRIKPDIAAPTHVSTVSYGRFVSMDRAWGFGGTSAATPHLAGAAALVIQALKAQGKTPSPQEVQAFLEGRAEDLGEPGKDNKYGSGQLFLGQPPIPPPRAPTGLQVTVQGPWAVLLNWQDNSDNEEGFKVERRLQTAQAYQEIKTLPANTTSFLDDRLSPETGYCWRVRAFNAGGNSDYSNEACATTPSENRPPTADAGPDQTVKTLEVVQLDGSRSSDPDGDLLSYSWRFIRMPTGSQATLSNPNIVNPTFIPDLVGEYLIELTVNDGRGGQAQDQVKITAQLASFTFEARMEQGVASLVELPSAIREKLPTRAHFEERPNTTRDGRTSDSLADAGLQLSPNTGSIFGSPTKSGSFQFLIEALIDSNPVVEIWALITIIPSVPVIAVSPQTLEFSAFLGGPNPEPKMLTITNAGGGTLEWEASFDVGWLKVSPERGTAPSTLTVSVDITGLSAATYAGRITITAPNATNSPLAVPVTLTISPPSLLTLKFTQLLFVGEGWERTLMSGCVSYKNASSGKVQVALAEGSFKEYMTPAGREVLACGELLYLESLGEPVPIEGLSAGSTTLVLKFSHIDWGDPARWERSTREGCQVHKNISSEPNRIRVTLADGSIKEFAIPSDQEVILCGDVVHIQA